VRVPTVIVIVGVLQSSLAQGRCWAKLAIMRRQSVQDDLLSGGLVALKGRSRRAFARSSHLGKIDSAEEQALSLMRITMNICSRLKLSRTVALVPLMAVMLAAPVNGQQIGQSQQIFSANVIKPSGQPIIPLFDGWFPNNDGTNSLCFGYFNLNSEESLDIPLGENNHLSDDRFDALIPTHFEPVPPRYRHKFCVFTVIVPADFGVDEEIIWSLTIDEQTLSVPGRIIPPYVMDEPASGGRGNVAPWVRMSLDGPRGRGRNGIHAESVLSASVGESITIPVWIEHPEKNVWLGWSKHTGPGDVGFMLPEYGIVINNRAPATRATAVASFSEPGDYVIRMQTINTVAAFEFYCCHTNAYFNVSVSP
jgi:hypothetical protein